MNDSCCPFCGESDYDVIDEKWSFDSYTETCACNNCYGLYELQFKVQFKKKVPLESPED